MQTNATPAVYLPGAQVVDGGGSRFERTEGNFRQSAAAKSARAGAPSLYGSVLPLLEEVGRRYLSSRVGRYLGKPEGGRVQGSSLVTCKGGRGGGRTRRMSSGISEPLTLSVGKPSKDVSQAGRGGLYGRLRVLARGRGERDGNENENVNVLQCSVYSDFLSTYLVSR